jgi:hypothetical protein
MKVNSEAIYGVKQLKNYKEGDNIRYTLSSDRKYIYALLFNQPAKLMEFKQIKPVENSVIRMLGLESDLKWNWDEKKGLSIELPDSLLDPANLSCKYVWVLKIEGTEI